MELSDESSSGSARALKKLSCLIACVLIESDERGIAGACVLVVEAVCTRAHSATGSDAREAERQTDWNDLIDVHCCVSV